MISSTQALTSATLGGTPTTPIPVVWEFLLATDLTVVQTRANVDTLLVLNTDYTVTGGGSVPTTGTVVPITSLTGDLLTIYRSVPETQILNLTSLSSFPSESVETNFDRITMQLQTMKLRLDRTLSGPISGPVLAAMGSVTDRASKYLFFDSNGLPTFAAGTADTALAKNSIQLDSGQYQLVGDSASPGNDKLYGTNGSGTRGWYSQPVNVLPSQSTHSGKYLTTDGSNASWSSNLALAGTLSVTGTTILTGLASLNGGLSIITSSPPNPLFNVSGTTTFTTGTVYGYLYQGTVAGSTGGTYRNLMVGGTTTHTALAGWDGLVVAPTFTSGAITTVHGVLVQPVFSISPTNFHAYRSTVPAATGRYNLYMDGTAWNYIRGNLGVGSAPTAETTLYMAKTTDAGATSAAGVHAIEQIDSTKTVQYQTFQSRPYTQAAVFTLGDLYHFVANPFTFGAGSVVSRQYGFFASSNLSAAGTNYGFYGLVASAATNYNLYMAGTAANYLAGKTGIGQLPSATDTFAVTGTSLFRGAVLQDFFGAGGNALVGRYNSTNQRGGIYINGSAGSAFLGGNLNWSSSSTFNYDRTAAAWAVGDAGGQNALCFYWVTSGTSGNSAIDASSNTQRVGFYNATGWNLSTGVAVTGAGSFTGNVTMSSATAVLVFSGATYGQIQATTGDLYLSVPTAKGINQQVNGVTISAISGTGVAFTGVGSFSGVVTASTAPTLGGHLCNKTYVDSLAGGIKPREACKVATTVALPTYTGTGTNVLTASANGAFPTTDGVTLVVNERVLFKNGASTNDNGVYTLSTVGTGGTPWVLTRATDADATGETTVNQTYLITSGTTLGNTTWFILTAPATLNSNPLIFAQYSASSTYLAGTGLLLTGSTFSIDTAIVMQKASNLSDVASRITAKANLYIIQVNVMDYGADNTGVADSTTAFTNAIAACAPTGGITNIILNSAKSGYGVPANDWTGRPSITATRGLSGASGFQAYGNINHDGYLSSVEISAVGTGYDILTYTCNKTSGSAIITLSSGSFDARIIAGVSARHGSVTEGCYVVTRDSSTQLTLSENMDLTNADQFVFGMPIINLAGTPNYVDFISVIGNPKTLKVPPGSYKLPTGIGYLGGMSNLTVEAEGAEFYSVTNTGTVNVTVSQSSGVTFNGGSFRNRGARYSVPNSGDGRSVRYAGQSGISISQSHLVTFNNVRHYDGFMFGVQISGSETADKRQSNRINFNNCEIINPLGDGIHVDPGCHDVLIDNCRIVHPGDDALAVTGATASTAAANVTTNVTFQNCHIEGGTYRGCLAYGGNGITFKNITGRGTRGAFVEIGADGDYVAPSNVILDGITAIDLGDIAYAATGAFSLRGQGIYARSTMTGLTIRGCHFTQHSSSPANTILDIDTAVISSLNWDQQSIISTGATTTFTGSANTDLNCQAVDNFASLTLPVGRWKVEGSIPLRYSVLGNGMWPIIYDGTTEYGGGVQFSTNDQSLRCPCPVSAIVEVNSGTKVVNFKIKQGGGGIVIDAGTAYGPNSYLQATRI